MTDNQVTAVSRIHALPEVQAEVERALLKLVQQAQAEAGCIEFDLHRALDDSCQFWISECWADQEALDRHLAQPRLKAWLRESKRLVAEPIQITLGRRISRSV